MGYDTGGNVVSVTPPGKAAHGFSWGPTDRVAAYQPPSVGFAPKDTSYAHDDDGLLLQMVQPVTLTRDVLGRPEQITDAVTKTFAYDAQGRLSTIATSDGVTLTHTYDGALLAQQAVSGPFAHALNC